MTDKAVAAKVVVLGFAAALGEHGTIAESCGDVSIKDAFWFRQHGSQLV